MPHINFFNDIIMNSIPFSKKLYLLIPINDKELPLNIKLHKNLQIARLTKYNKEILACVLRKREVKSGVVKSKIKNRDKCKKTEKYKPMILNMDGSISELNNEVEYIICVIETEITINLINKLNKSTHKIIVDEKYKAKDYKYKNILVN